MTPCAVACVPPLPLELEQTVQCKRHSATGCRVMRARRAQINERSSVLRCYLGMALAKVGKGGEALGCLGEAIAADPANPLAKFERAGVLLGLERFHDALAELEALRVRALDGRL